ncbi:MAG: DUF934 domain-containing protein [bacterium]
MALIRDRRIVEDEWSHLDDADAAPLVGAITVSWDRWQAERDALRARSGPVGVRLPNTVEPREIADDLDRLGLVTIDFPRFSDGRGYSLARLLRERHGYRGELRAVGYVLRDQLFYMKRCGFDAFALKEGKDAVGALAAFDEFDVLYQPAADEALPLWRRISRA